MIYWPQGQWGGVRARYCAPVHSCAVKWSRYTKWKMTADRLFASRHQASFKTGLIASPCSWSWFKVLTQEPIKWWTPGWWAPGWRQFRDALQVPGTCFKRAFPQLRSPPSPCQPCEKWCTSQKQREVIFNLPRPLPPKVPDRTASKYTPHPQAQMAGLVPVVARGIVTGLTNWTVHQWQFSLITSPFALASLRCVPP